MRRPGVRRARGRARDGRWTSSRVTWPGCPVHTGQRVGVVRLAGMPVHTRLSWLSGHHGGRPWLCARASARAFSTASTEIRGETGPAATTPAQIYPDGVVTCFSLLTGLSKVSGSRRSETRSRLGQARSRPLSSPRVPLLLGWAASIVAGKALGGRIPGPISFAQLRIHPAVAGSRIPAYCSTRHPLTARKSRDQPQWTDPRPLWTPARVRGTVERCLN